MTEIPLLPPRQRGVLHRPDGTIAYEVTGTGPAIVFAHGLGGNHLSWFQQVAHFAPRWTCVTFAHRGFAPSSPIQGGPDPADYASDLAALIAHLNLADTRIVAQSMGGWTAVEYALLRPAGLRAVVLAATTGTIDLQRLRDSERDKLPAWRDASSALAPRLAASGIHVAAGARMAAEQPALHLLYRHIDDMNAGLDKEALRARLGQGRTRAPEELADTGVPVLMLAGDEDIVMPPFAAEAIAAVVPGATAARIPLAGHSAYFERAATFNLLVERFLEPTRGDGTRLNAE
jgi:pimeloyl-ACP methyl ester carboxylesterase